MSRKLDFYIMYSTDRSVVCARTQKSLSPVVA
nr:MAG TPA: hypothetical protein [Caudoviricetes sp.]